MNRGRWLALGLYVSCVALAALCLAVAHVSAEVRARSVELGDGLAQWQGLTGRRTDLVWNGERLSASTLTLDQPLVGVMDRFTELCDDGMHDLAQELAVRLEPARKVEPSVLQRALVLRQENGDGVGAAVCLAGAGERGLRGLLDGIAAFASSRDIAHLGKLRYMRARESDAGTHVVLITADGPLRFDRLFPAEGQEAEGSDLVSGVRPADSTRVIAAHALGTAHALTAYRSTRSATAAIDDYGQRLVARGFVPLDVRKLTPGGRPLTSSEQMITTTYTRGDQTLLAVSEPDEQGSLLSVVQLSALPAAALRRAP